MFRRFVSLLSAALILSGLTLAVSEPAQAWGYCNHTIVSGAVNLYDNQGYCGGNGYVFQATPGVCVNIPSGWNNWAGSLDNATTVAVLMHDAPNCAAGASRLFPSHTGNPDLFSLGFNNTFSSIRFGGPV